MLLLEIKIEDILLPEIKIAYLERIDECWSFRFHKIFTASLVIFCRDFFFHVCISVTLCLNFAESE